MTKYNSNNLMNKGVVTIFICSILQLQTIARPFENVKRVAAVQKTSADACLPSTSQIDLDVNNVRARILGGGDMWWDQGLGAARYEIPKDSKKYSLFASSLWIGGIDVGGQLKVAAQTYRQTGNDLWPGPLDTLAITNKEICDLYNRHWKISKKEVEDFRKAAPGSTPPASILNWPGNQLAGVPSTYEHNLAPYFDKNSDGNYSPLDGDYPKYDFSPNTGGGTCDEGYLYGDQTIWWVVNDKGNIHTETTAQPIGLEIQCQAFGFQTSDEVNNMTFYKYKIINRSSFDMNDTYFGLWVDADLGNAYDDAVGCDVPRGVAYTYNFDDNDETGIGYGLHPPAIGIDFFKGPKADPYTIIKKDQNGNDVSVPADRPASMSNNGLGFGDGIIGNEFWGMEKCIVFMNNSSAQGNPFNGNHIYNYLRARWKDGTPMTYGGNGTGGTPTNYMYPWDTDPAHKGEPLWKNISLTPDLRTVQSAGPFTLKSGAVNYVTSGAVWARANSTPVASVTAVIEADKKAQSLFDNCFRIVDGPDAPVVTSQELDQEVILNITNPVTSNNYRELYKEKNPNILNPVNPEDAYYKFEGYKIYQLAEATVTADNLSDPTLAQLVRQCDIKNNITRIINKKLDAETETEVGKIMVEGTNEGITHSFKITEDAFNVGTKLVNYKKYYFMVIAYAYNNYSVMVNGEVVQNAQKEPYLAGRRYSQVTLIPHIPSAEKAGTIIQGAYGSGPVITREEGQGNGGNFLELTQESIDAILKLNVNETFRNVTYKGGSGPVSVKVIDPLNVPDAKFELKIIPQDSVLVGDKFVKLIGEDNKMSNAIWTLTKIDKDGNEEIVMSENPINLPNEQIIEKWGLAIKVNQVENPGSNLQIDKNGLLGSSITFSGSGQKWLTGVADADGETPLNWIRSGTVVFKEGDPKNPKFPSSVFADWAFDYVYGKTTRFKGYDEFEEYEKVVNGTWAPYTLTTNEAYGPMILSNNNDFYKHGSSFSIKGDSSESKGVLINKLQNLASVDVVFTSDKTKWTRCPVIETGFDKFLNNNSLNWNRPPIRGELRSHKSVDKNGLSIGDEGVNSEEANFIASEGMGWFPGYAINVETGERLNMAFGESSKLIGENGNDMKWNPTDKYTDDYGKLVFGGLHFVYVFNHNSFSNNITGTDKNTMPSYDGGKYIHDKLMVSVSKALGASSIELMQVWRDCIWANFPLLEQNHKLLENDATVKLRVNKSFSKFYAANAYSADFQFQNVDQNGKTIIAKYDANNTATSSNVKNNNYPRYSFDMKNLATLTGQNNSAKNALELINVVPNPYYGYSEYEDTQIDNIVKITNLPVKCTVSIYTVNGTLIRQIEKDNDLTFIDWDLKSQSNVPIGSGLYIIHVNAPNIGEKIVKWFGAMRPVDLNSF